MLGGRGPKKTRLSSTVDWLSLPRELLVTIAKLTLLGSVEDFMAFRATCTSWNEAGSDNECFKPVRWPRVPFLMIPDRGQFYSLSRKKCCGMRVPFSEGKCNGFTESRFGWMLSLAKSGQADLLYPFSGARIQLPKCDSLSYAKRSVLSANPSETSDYVLVVLTRHYMVFWRPGDQSWTEMESYRFAFYDLIFYSKDRKFYAVTETGQIWVWDMANRDSAVLVKVSPLSRTLQIFETYLVESSAAELLLVRKNFGSHHSLVYRLGVTRGVWEGVSSLKDAIFVGRNASFSILPSVDDPVIKPGCIYFTNDNGLLSNDMGIYNPGDASIQLFPPSAYSCNLFGNPPLWVAPSSLSFVASLGANFTRPL